MIFDKWFIPTMTIAGYGQRYSLMIFFLASVAVLIVATSVGAFIYVTRKQKLLRKFHLASVIVIILLELIFLTAVVSCFIIQSKNTQGQILAALLIVISFLALMALIFFLLEDLLKGRIEPRVDDTTRSKSVTVQVTSRHSSPPPSEEVAIPIATQPEPIPLPRLPTPPLLPAATPPPDQLESPPSEESEPLPPPEKSSSPPPPSEKPATPPPTPEKSPTPPPAPIEPTVPQTPESPPPYIVHYERIRRELLAAIDERTIPALEEAIQQVKDHDYIQPLKYECERALELLNRLMKIEHTKFSRVPWGRIKVLRLNQPTIAELHSYTKPPDEVSTVMRATFLLLGHSNREIQDWPQIQNLLGRFGRESIRRRCYELNPLNIPVDKAREAKDILRNYDILRVNEISVGLTAFFNWAMTMVDEREKLLESQRRLVR